MTKSIKITATRRPSPDVARLVLAVLLLVREKAADNSVKEGRRAQPR